MSLYDHFLHVYEGQGRGSEGINDAIILDSKLIKESKREAGEKTRTT